MSSERLRVRRTVPFGEAGAHIGCLGEGTAGGSWLWLDTGGAGIECGAMITPFRDGVLACPPGVPENRSLETLGYWPAWRSVERSGLELGGGVLILGAGWLASTISELCRLRVCSWRAVASAVSDCPAEVRLPDPVAIGAGAIGRQLPAQPDAMILIGEAAGHLAEFLPVCRSKGTVVLVDPRGSTDLDFYHDAHKRGLRLVTISSTAHGPDDLQAWPRAARCLGRLLERGSITGEGLKS